MSMARKKKESAAEDLAGDLADDMGFVFLGGPEDQSSFDEDFDHDRKPPRHKGIQNAPPAPWSPKEMEI